MWFCLFCCYDLRYKHCHTNFGENRGILSLRQHIVDTNLPAKGYLDYAWLQCNYYTEKTQGYGMNWLPWKPQGSSAWNVGKIMTLFEVSYTSTSASTFFIVTFNVTAVDIIHFHILCVSSVCLFYEPKGWGNRVLPPHGYRW